MDDTTRTFCEHLAAALLVGAVVALWLVLTGYGLWQGGRFALGARADAWPLVWGVLVPTVLVGSVWHAWRNTFASDEREQ